VHESDITSICYCKNGNLLFTGSQDGSLVGWNFETGQKKFELHENDPTCKETTKSL